MRVSELLFLALLASPAAAQDIVASGGPDRVQITVYRDPDRGEQRFNLDWLNGYALVSETRTVTLPAGLSEVRFEGVTAGIVPQSAILTGLGEAVLEKNRDARLLSPGSLLDAALGERLQLRRTNLATGAVTMQDALVRSTVEGIVIETAAGVEALRCTGLPETLLAARIPAGLSAKPTLSVMVRSPRPATRQVTLSYITNNFDWQADYVAEIGERGDTLALFGWMTIANGDSTALANAATNAVAGRLNRERIWVDPGRAEPIRIQCWPQGTTSDIPEAQPVTVMNAEEIMVTGSRVGAPPPPPPPAPVAERGGDEYQAREERLGDVRLYRVPIAVTVAAKSQKQIAMLRQPAVKVASIVRLRPGAGPYETALERLLVSRNRPLEGLGVALPAGKVTLYGRRGGRRVLLGEGAISDLAVGEKVEIPLGAAPGIRAVQVQSANDPDTNVLTLTNDSSFPQTAEIELPLAVRTASQRLETRDGWKLWRVTIPANGSAELSYRY